jgi:ferritin-like metal-binding protein YciE
MGRSVKPAANPRNDLEKILVDLMKDIYYAEKKITKALAKMAKKCSNEQLRDAFDTHRAETEDQIQKLERAFDTIGQKVKAKKCAAMDGLVEESDEHMKEFEKGAGLDAALLIGAQKVEHYEIAAYGSMRSIAETLGYTEAAGIFEDILEQERDTDEKLTQLAESVINVEAEDEKDGEEIASGNGNSSGGFSSDGRGRSDAMSRSQRPQMAGVADNDGAGRGISALTDGNDRGEMSETGPAMGY